MRIGEVRVINGAHVERIANGKYTVDGRKIGRGGEVAPAMRKSAQDAVVRALLSAPSQEVA